MTKYSNNTTYEWYKTGLLSDLLTTVNVSIFNYAELFSTCSVGAFIRFDTHIHLFA